MLLAPAVWSLMPVMAPGNPMIPVAADPSLLTGTSGLAPAPVDLAEILPLVNYLRASTRGAVPPRDFQPDRGRVDHRRDGRARDGHGQLPRDQPDPHARPARADDRDRSDALALVPIRTAAQPGGIGSRPSPGGRVVSPALWRPDLRARGIPAGPDFRRPGADHLVTSRRLSNPGEEGAPLRPAGADEELIDLQAGVDDGTFP